MKRKKDDPTQQMVLWRLVGGKLRAQLQSEAGTCPDTEVLAAYFDRTLTPHERDECFSHLTACARCQEHVAELARLAEAEEKQAEVVVEEAAHVEPRRRGFAAFRLAWAAPLLVAIVVAGLWYSGDLRRVVERRQEPTEPTTEAAGAPGTPAETAEAPQPASPAARELEKALRAEERKAESAAAVGQPGPAGATPSSAAPAQLSVQAAPAEGSDLKLMVEPAPRAPMAKAERQAYITDEMARAPAPAAAKAVAPAIKEMPAATRSRALAETSGAPGVTVMGFTDRAAQSWRTGRHGMLQRLEPSGTWATVLTGVDADLFDISFASSTVGWAVGQAGTVMRTTDGGVTWRRVTSPTEEDLVRVGAISETSVRVMTRGGRTFSTTDGGKSWGQVEE